MVPFGALHWCRLTPNVAVMHTSNGPAIKAIRQAQGWSGVSFAKALGISHGHLFNIENPERRQKASPKVLHDMAQVLGVPVAALSSAYTVEQITGKPARARKTPQAKAA